MRTSLCINGVINIYLLLHQSKRFKKKSKISIIKIIINKYSNIAVLY